MVKGVVGFRPERQLELFIPQGKALANPQIHVRETRTAEFVSRASLQPSRSRKCRKCRRRIFEQLDTITDVRVGMWINFQRHLVAVENWITRVSKCYRRGVVQDREREAGAESVSSG